MTVYHKREFWLNIIKTKKILDLTSIKLEGKIDEEVISKAIKQLIKKLTSNLEFKEINGLWEIKIINKNLNSRELVYQELKLLKNKKGSGLN